MQPDKVVPFKFVSEIALPAKNFEIRSYLIFKDINSREIVVDRCPLHLNLHNDFDSRHHVLDAIDGKHIICPSTNRYVTIFKPGITHSKHEINSFIGNMCFRCGSGCRGGIDRRPIFALFELYVNKKFSGRAAIEVSICSSPGRDRVNQEKKKMLPGSPQNIKTCINETQRCRPANDDENDHVKRVCLHNSALGSYSGGQYLIAVTGHENAMLLRAMAEKMNHLEDLKLKNK